MRGTLDTDVTSCVPPPATQRKKGFSARWSLRRFIYSSPILGRRRTPPNPTSTGTAKSTNWGRDSADVGKIGPGGSSTTVKSEVEKGTGSGLNNHHHAEIHKATSRSSVFTASTKVSIIWTQQWYNLFLYTVVIIGVNIYYIIILITNNRS